MMLQREVVQGRLAHNIDDGSWEATRNVLYRGLSGTQQVCCISDDTEACQLFQYLCLAGERIIGEKEIFFVMCLEPVDTFFSAGEQFVAPVDNSVQVDQVSSER